MTERRVTAVDLFCGIGGLTHGLVQAGITVSAGVDSDPTCKFAFEANNPGTRFIEKSVTDLRSGEISSLYPKSGWRILVGCAPCQPFSNYTNRYPRDERWRLLYSFRDLIADLRPDVVSMENVPELAERKHKVYEDFVAALKNYGYSVYSRVVRCADYGVPQRRTRLVLLASLHGPIEMISPTHSDANWPTVRDAIGALPSIVAGGKPLPDDPLHVACRLSPTNLKRIRATPEGGGWKDWPEELLLACHRRETGSQYLSVYGRMSWTDLAPTMTTQCYGFGNGRFGHPDQDRAISLREAALLQTFPRDYRFARPDKRITFKHTGKHIGNSVPVALGRAIGTSIVRHLAALGVSYAANFRSRKKRSKLAITSRK
jgi:DNA (cytosine-5)-methyltransferase 1